MKKILLSTILALLCLVTLTSCARLVDDILLSILSDQETEQETSAFSDESTDTLPAETEAQTPEETTETPTEEITEPPTEAPQETVPEETTETPTEEITEPSSEAPQDTDPETSADTDSVSIPEETTASEEEYLSDLLDTLQAEGCDMEQLTFSGAAKNGVEYRYTVTFPKRIFRKGETVEINVTEIVHVGDDLDLQEDMETGFFEVCMDLRGKVIYSNTNEYRWKEGNTIFFEIPEDFESGAYMLCLFINEWGENIGPIVIY